MRANNIYSTLMRENDIYSTLTRENNFAICTFSRFNEQEMTEKWLRNDPEMTKKWPRNDQEMTKNEWEISFMTVKDWYPPFSFVVPKQ